MKVNYNNEFFKVAKPEIPQTYQEFTQTTLPGLLSPDSLPSEYTLRYFDSESCHIKIRNERDYQTMCQEMEKLQHELFLCVLPEQQEINLKDILSSMLNVQPNYDPYFQKQAQKNTALVNRSGKIPIIKLEEEDEEPKKLLEVETIKDSSASPKTSSLENMERTVNESEALRKGLSDHIEEIQREEKKKPEEEEKHEKPKNNRKRNPEKKGSRLLNELRGLEKDQKALVGSWEESIDDQNQKDNEDIEEEKIEKKIQTLPVRDMLVTHEKRKLFDEKIDEIQEKWKDDFRVKADIETGFLQLMAVQEQVTKSRSKPNTNINDTNIKKTMKNLVEALKIEDYNSLKIDNLVLNFKGCENLSKYGVSYLFKMINKKFKYVRSLSLDFSFNQSSLKTSPVVSKIALNLRQLESLRLNFSNRCDITKEETDMIIESLKKNSKESLKTLNLFLPTMFYVKPETKKNFKSKLTFVKNLKVFPPL